MFFFDQCAAVNCQPHDHWSRFSAGSAAGMVLYQALVPLQIVCPGMSVKDSLGELEVDSKKRVSWGELLTLPSGKLR